jgi:Skp family chaperone for outer membrane proteins
MKATILKKMAEGKKLGLIGRCLLVAGLVLGCVGCETADEQELAGSPLLPEAAAVSPDSSSVEQEEAMPPSAWWSAADEAGSAEVNVDVKEEEAVDVAQTDPELGRDSSVAYVEAGSTHQIIPSQPEQGIGEGQALIPPQPAEITTHRRECPKIGVVSVRRIFQDCRRNAKYRQELTTKRDRIAAEIEKLSNEIDVGKAGLKALKPGSPDYLSGVKEVLEKQARLQAQQEFYKRQMELSEQIAIEGLYKDVIEATAEVAKEKSLDLVLERSELDLPAGSSNELTLTISTNKVLYNAGCEDITDAVLAKVDALEEQ